eukprot:RCo042255
MLSRCRARPSRFAWRCLVGTPSRRVMSESCGGGCSGGGAPAGNLFEPTPEHRALRETARAFTRKEVEPQALEYNRKEKLNYPLLKKMGDLGMLGLTADPAHGGSGMDCLGACIVHEELGWSDPAFAMTYLAHAMLFTNNVTQNASEAQKAKYLPRACSGEALCGMAMTEPAAGTDVLGMRTTARRQGDYYILNGSKMFITNGAKSDTETGDVYLVYAKTGPVDDNKNISMFLVEKGMPGFSLGQVLKDKCGMRASPTAELVFSDCKVPAENLVGREGGAVKCMMRNLELERLTLSAIGLGLAARSLEVMLQYSQDRKAFGQPLHSFGQIQKYIGDSYAAFMAGRVYLYNTAAQVKLHQAGNRLDTDGVKLFVTPMAKTVADAAMQVLGGNGYIGSYAVERLWRDAKLLEIGGGTLESHQKNMTRDLLGKSAII